jgi:DNA helicase HerA-like ATPase
MNNSKDRGYVSAALQDELRSIVDLLPSLRTGEAIVSGEGVSIPSRVKFSKLTNAPKSEDPVASKQWNHPYFLRESDYNQLVSLWRNKKFEVEDTSDE